MKKTFTTALTGEEMQSPFGGWRHHLPPAEPERGEASAAIQSAECLFCHMTLKANPVTFLRPL